MSKSDSGSVGEDQALGETSAGKVGEMDPSVSGTGKMLIYARLRPSENATEYLKINDEKTRMEFSFPKDDSMGLINNTRTYYDFKFDQIFDMEDKQDAVFDKVAKDAVENTLRGYNASIFAYGQTGSGKTFTITGGPERYVDRGIIPRVLQMMFAEFETRPDSYSAEISYLEIYKDRGYDLLNANNDAEDLDRLSSVKMHEDEDGSFYMKDLRFFPATSEEEAVNLLFEGDTNRMIASTPMNQASSRSHCIFTIRLTCRPAGSDMIRRSKLNLIDLAGSERVYKTSAEGTLLEEGKSINVSLHFLEQVIVALQLKQKDKTKHVPYRNSVMTSLLKDSLGGNCRTSMIGTLSVEPQHLDESISTCRFAQRCALVKMNATVNEELDPYMVIRRLRAEIKQLKEELALATGGQSTDELTAEECEKIHELVNEYVANRDEEATLSFGDFRKITEAFRYFKTLLNSAQSQPISTSGLPLTLPAPTAIPEKETANDPNITKLRQQIQQRDAEIKILVGMLNKKKPSCAVSTQTLVGYHATMGSTSNEAPLTSVSMFTRSSSTPGERVADSLPPPAGNGAESSSHVRPQSGHEPSTPKAFTVIIPDREKAFDGFKRGYQGNSAIEENKQLLREKYAEAKKLGTLINESRSKISSYKAVIEQLRVERAMQGGNLETQNDPEEELNKKHIEDEKLTYKRHFLRMKTLKGEIEHIQQLLEQCRIRLKKDFDEFYATLIAKAKAQSAHPEKSSPPSRLPRPSETQEFGNSAPPLTGNAQVDAEVAAFYRAKDVILQRNSQSKS